ncbi:Hypothetical predicted protein [Mytilus galloprovincialis]|uniref:Uncharacterized protein n=1 Tax=Mytilus galloprovincialis TaxID=29158 RepID=A0A8B6C810_MYTGA|nr:Hypothetical predicted protein [Mytilus galloprovincialis]
MLNAQQHVHTNSSFRSNIANSEYEEVLAEYYPAEYEEVIAEYHSTEYEEVVAEYHSTENEEVVAEYHPTEYEEVVAEYQSTEYEELVAEYHPTVYEEVVTEYHPTEYEEVVAEYHSIEYEEVVAEYHSTEYLEVVAEYHLTEYEEAHSIQRANTSNAVHIAVPNFPLNLQRIHISLWLLCLIIICSLIAIVLTGVVTFLVTRKTLPKTKCQDAEEINCHWSSWSSWYKCSVTCGIGIQIRIKQQMSNTTLCSKNETFDSKICSRGECTGDEDLLDMRFSRTALYKYWFISADNTIISNVQTIDTSSSADAQLQNYMGTIADICVGDNELIYYEVNYVHIQ